MIDNWTRDQLLVAFNLYCRIPFSKTKATNPSVIQIANLIGRSPAAVAMKLGNFGSFDTALRTKGIRGLSGASKGDLSIWEEFNQSWEKLSIESELATDRLQSSTRDKPLNSTIKRIGKAYPSRFEKILTGPSEAAREVKVRLHQRFFRDAVLASYRVSCCVCSNRIPQLLTAAHIIPWEAREDLRANPRNGLCLCSLHHNAFDCGFWTIDESYEIKLSTELVAYLPSKTLEENFVRYENAQICMPDKFWPAKDFLGYHRVNLFRQ
jgi:putative restriction endonuclease